MSEMIFNIIAKHPEEEQIPGQVQEPTMQKLRGY